jgi:glutathione-regulated potassium-efflux system ancillary protein KefG
MNRILILFAHPALEKSRVNRRLIAGVQDLEGVTFHDLPSILKEWQDLVLQHGWAYGSEGKRLVGKRALNVLTTGGRENAYQADGYNRFTMRQFLAPLEQTFRLCGVEYLPPFVVHGTHRMTPEQMQSHATDYRRLLEALRDDRLASGVVDEHPRLNWRLNEIVIPERETD